jgi:hypothetical protein
VPLPSNKDDHSHPYEHAATNPPVGPLDVSISTGSRWSITGIPLSGSPFALYVWGLFDSASFVHPAGGAGNEYTLGSGSGSIGSCGSGSGSPEVGVALRQRRPAAVDAVPRVYRLTIDVGSMNLAAYGAGYLTEGLLSSAALYLTHDERVSTPEHPVWSARNLADAMGLWTLRVACDCSHPAARVYFQQIERRKVATPLVWKTSKWSFHAGNTLIAAERAAVGLASPDIRVEPA